jgi:uncharacterized protein YbaP (TraB family)
MTHPAPSAPSSPPSTPSPLPPLPPHVRPIAEVNADELFEQWARQDAPRPMRPARHPALLAFVFAMSCFLSYKTWPAMEALIQSNDLTDCGAPLDRALARKRGEPVRPFQHLERCELEGVVQHMSLFAIGHQESPDAPTEQERMRGVSFVTKLSGDNIFVILPAQEEWVHAYRLKNGSLFGLEFKARGLMVQPREEPLYQRLAEQVRHNFYVPENEELWLFDVSYSPWDHKMPLLTFTLSPLIALISLFGLRRSLAQRALLTAPALTLTLALALTAPLGREARAEVPQAAATHPQARPGGASEWRAPFLWEARCPQGRALLFGTMHVPDPRFNPLHPRVLQALQESAAVYGELDLRDKASLMPKMMARMTLPAGETLEGRLGAEGYEALRSYLNAKGFGAALAGMSGFHPSLVEMTLPMLDMIQRFGAGGKVIDEVIQERAVALGKQVGGVETVDEQLNALLSMNDTEANESLISTVRDLQERLRRGEDPLSEIIGAYFSGVDQELSEVMGKETARATQAQHRVLNKLLHVRNKRMSERLLALLSPGAPKLFAFGVAHFVINDAKNTSVLTSLKEAGCAIERLTPPATGDTP